MNTAGISDTCAIKAFRKAGFKIVRINGHIVMKNETNCIAVIPKTREINPLTMNRIIKGAGFNVKKFISTYL